MSNWTKLLALTSLVFAFGVQPAGARHKLTCAHSGSTVVRTAQSRVFDYNDTAYACLLHGHLIKRLGAYYDCESPSCDGVGDFHLRGPYVAYQYFAFDYGTDDAAVYSVSLRTGDRVQGWGRWGQATTCNDVTALVLGNRGSIAWIARAQESCNAGPYTYQVWRSDTTGQAVVDSAQNVSPKSLAVANGTIYWTAGGQPRSAPLRS